MVQAPEQKKLRKEIAVAKRDFPMGWLTLRRQPERPMVYNNPTESHLYHQSLQSNAIQKASQMYVDKILRQFGSWSSLRVLDVGCGPGTVPVQLAAKRPNWSVTGLDYSTSMIDIAKQTAQAQNVSVRFQQGSVERLPYESGFFDLVICHFAFHEFPDAARALEEMRRVTKQGGWLFIEDLHRPNRIVYPLALAGAYLFNLSRPDTWRQIKESMRAAYTVANLQHLTNSWEEKTEVSSFFSPCGPLLQIKINRISPVDQPVPERTEIMI